MRTSPFTAIGLSAFLLISGASAQSANYNDIIFLRGPNCNPGGRIFYYDSKASIRSNCTYGYQCENDTIRSVWIAPTVRPGTRIRVYDNSDGERSDDWAEVTIKTVRSNFDASFAGREGMCIPSFEVNRDGPDYSIRYRRRDNLDGKISRIEIDAVKANPAAILKRRR